MPFAIAAPTVLALGGLAIDYVSVTRHSGRLQTMVDSAALAAAREMTLRSLSNADAQNVVMTYIAANIPANIPYPIVATAAIEGEGFSVRVRGQQRIETPLGLLESLSGVNEVTAEAVATIPRSAQQTKLCLLSLATATNGGIHMHNGSYIEAVDCVFYSNSTHKRAVVLNKNSTIKANLICARGGIDNDASTLVGTLVTDCPVQADPLATKPAPSVPLACKETGLKIKGQVRTLDPGHYCAGVDISGGARVTLNPGVYYFSNGALRVRDTSAISGNGVTLAFTDAKAYFRFEDDALVKISAPTAGATAGMLIWELPVAGLSSYSASSTITMGLKPKDTSKHRISATRAYQLTGTIYLPRGLLTIDSKQPIAAESEYTILVVQTLDLFDGPRLVLNSNYKNSVVPVPAGLGPLGAGQIRLSGL
jgi:Flp pilus assembly protein TadG